MVPQPPPPKCLPDASQMLPRCFPDVSQMLPRCLSDASQMPPRCLPDVSSMIPPQQLHLHDSSSITNKTKFGVSSWCHIYIYGGVSLVSRSAGKENGPHPWWDPIPSRTGRSIFNQAAQKVWQPAWRTLCETLCQVGTPRPRCTPAGIHSSVAQTCQPIFPGYV